MDKGYYDYDYSEPKRKAVEDVAPRSKEETKSLVARFGVGTAKPKLTAEELQNVIMDSESNEQ